MSVTFQIGMRYLRSKKQRFVSAITLTAITAVALGVAALLSVRSITSGFQQEFRDKVLGVNAHVLVLKYGIDFDEYRDVVERAREMPEVAGAGPFLINEMMMAKGDRLSGVLVKGIDPEAMPDVLDLPRQVVMGTLMGLRREGARPPVDPDNLTAGSGRESWDWLEEYREDPDREPPAAGSPDAGVDPLEGVDTEALLQHVLGTDGGVLLPDGGLPEELRPRRHRAAWDPPAPARDGRGVLGGAGGFGGDDDAPPAAPGEDDEELEPLPTVEVASVADVEAALQGFDADTLDMPDDEWEAQYVADELERMRQEQEGTQDLPGIVVGKTLAQNLGVGIGDRVTLISPLSGLDVSMFADAEQRAPRSRDFRVLAIFEAGFQEYDSRLVYTDLYEAQRFYNQGDSVTGVEMRLHDLERSNEVARRLERELGGPFHTLDWAELNRNLFTALEIQKIMLSLVITTIIFVAAFMVVATLIMIVLEKKKETAILKAMGATDLTILGIFTLQGVVIGLVGTAVGLLLGGSVVGYLKFYEFPLDPKVYLIDHLPVVVSVYEFLFTAVVALIICTLATVVPSYWGARRLPVEGLRHE